MKGYRFKLESALRVRRLQEESARARLAHARLEYDQAVAETSRRRGILNRARAEMDTEESSTGDWQRERERLDRLALSLKAQQLAEAHAFDTARHTHDHWSESLQDLRALERLDEAQREQWRIEALKAEQVELDELSSAREVRRRFGGRR